MLSFPRGPAMPPIPHTPDLTDAHRQIAELERQMRDVLRRLVALEREARMTGDTVKG